MANMNTANFADAIKTEYEKRLLVRAQPRLLHARWAIQARLNQMGSYELRRYEALSAMTTALSEGNTPDEQSQPTLTVITVTPTWYGAWMGFTDKLKMTSFDPILLEMAGILGEQAGLSIDTLVRNDLTDNVTADWSNGVSARASLAAPTDKITYADFVQQVALLEASNARGVIGEDFAVVLHPHTWATLMQDETFVTLFTRAEPGESNPLRTGFIGRILRCQLFVSSNARIYTNAGASSEEVYSMLFIGAQSYGIVGMGALTPNFGALDGGGPGYENRTGMATKPVEIIIKDLGEGGHDPLNQRGTMAYKYAHATQVLQAVFARNLEHINDFSA